MNEWRRVRSLSNGDYQIKFGLRILCFEVRLTMPQLSRHPKMRDTTVRTSSEARRIQTEVWFS